MGVIPLRFRHAAVRSMMGGKKKTQPLTVVHKPKFAEVVEAVTKSTMSPGNTVINNTVLSMIILHVSHLDAN